jgi:hypothetical protein
MFADATGTPDGHALVARAVGCLNAAQMTLSTINIIRTIHGEADRAGPCPEIDADIEREAGMDGNYARLLQAARNFDQARAEMIANDDPRY